jgi:citrate synthase
VRGLSLVDAARQGMRFEDVADHVLGARGSWSLAPARARALGSVLRRFARAVAQPIDVLPAVISAAALEPASSADWPALARELVVVASATLALPDPPNMRGDRAVALRVLEALDGRTDRAAIAAADAALVVLCEHELNVGTFAVRIAASADAGLHACVVAGLCALGGSRHGRASHRLAGLVAEVGRPGRADAVVAARLHDGDALAGFGHPLYPRGDPRAELLLAQARALPHPGAGLRTVLAIVDAAARRGAEPPNVDAGLVALAAALGMPLGTTSSGLFAVARIVGWVAHAIEQREAGVLLRPRARYVGG